MFPKVYSHIKFCSNRIPWSNFSLSVQASSLINEKSFCIHRTLIYRLSGQGEDAQTAFVQRWMEIHTADAKAIIMKPLVFGEFGKSKKDPDYSVSTRDAYMNVVYSDIYNLATNGGAMAGGLVWQILAEGMESYGDGYEIVLPEEPSTNAIMSQQSTRMKSLQRPSG